MSEYTISPITPVIEPLLAEVAQKAFGKSVAIIIPKRNLWGFYAHQGTHIAGAVYLKKMAPGEGSLDWIFVDPSAQGHKLGARLFRAGVDAMNQAGLSIQMALVRGSNTASWSMFAKEGYVKPSVFHSLTAYSWQSLPKRLGFHFVTGYNIWVKDPALKLPTHPTRFGILMTILFSAFIGLAISLFGYYGIDTLIIATTTVVGLTILRMVIEFLVARSYGPLRWNAPQGGTLLSGLIAFTGTWWPTFGFFSPKADTYRDSDYAKVNAYSRFATWMMHVGVYVLAAVINPDLFASGYGFILGFVLAVQLFFSFPFDDSDGARVYAYSKPMYIIGLLITLFAFIWVALLA